MSNRCWFHKWGPWQYKFPNSKLWQQRFCSKCNYSQTRGA